MTIQLAFFISSRQCYTRNRFSTDGFIVHSFFVHLQTVGVMSTLCSWDVYLQPEKRCASDPSGMRSEMGETLRTGTGQSIDPKALLIFCSKLSGSTVDMHAIPSSGVIKPRNSTKVFQKAGSGAICHVKNYIFFCLFYACYKQLAQESFDRNPPFSSRLPAFRRTL